MKRKIPLLVALSLVILAIALTVCVTMVFAMRHFSGLVNEVNERRDMYDYVAEIDTLVREHYEGEIDEEVLEASLAKGYIDGINDPYAAYYTPAEYAALQQQLSGSYTGFGIDLTVDADQQLVITGVLKGSAADQAGLKKQDVIVAVDGGDVSGEDFKSVKSRLENSARLMLTASRNGTASAYNLTGGTIALTSVEESMIEGTTTGYLRITRFSDNTPEQFRSAYSGLLDAGAETVIFDLRDNAGGSLDAAMEIVEYLMPRGVYANKSVSGSKETVALSANDTYQMDITTVTLVNGNTEGEAELFAGVLQEFAKTTVLGTQTAGRSRVQTYFTLPSDSAGIRLSVATLELIVGGSWEDVGITPNQVVEMTGDRPFELRNFKQDTQLQAALNQLSLVGG